LHECGYTRRIKDFEGHWAEESIKCANFGEKIVNTRINALIKFKTKQRICRLTTESGEEITATEDHPFYTQEGMTLLRNIRKGDEVAVFPFQGIEFSEPSNKIILSEEDITKLPLKKNFSQTINELKKRNLLPLRMNNEKLPYLLKLIGFILGDGTIYFTGNKGTIWFYGEPEDLEDIKNDIEKLGFKASKVYKRKRSHEIKTGYGDVKFDRVEYSIKTNASSLAALMWAMGLPVGNKCTQEYMLPNWLFDLELWQKRLFLASLFGAELSSPSTVTNHGYNFYSPILSMNKHEEFLENARQFLKQIKNLLNNFGVKSSLVGERKEFVNKNGKVSYRLQLRITSTPHNLINLWGRIGFEYNKKRLHSANVAILYLKLKENVLKERARAEKKAKELRKSGLNTSQICEELQSDYINHRFIERSLYGGRKVLPRVAFNFPTFNEFMNKRTSELGKTGLVWDRIVERKIIKLDDSVYDFNVANEHHNFIANNFAVSNCGVRLLRTNLRSKDLDEKKIRSLVDQMFANVPSGVGSKGKVRLRGKEIEDVLERGAKWAVENDYGWERDLQFIEEGGQMKIANASLVSQEAKRRGIPQVGSLGAGNHFLELQEVQEIYNPEVAKTFGIQNKGQITVMIHTGSRGCGHQICTDYLRVLERAVRKYNISLPDRQLACAPVKSKEAQDYFKAMACGANFAFANRQMITHWVREAFEKTLNRSAEEIGLEVVYDVCHNIAKLEEHQVGNKRRKVYVHRKGATRAFGKGYPQVSAKYREVGQPVLIPGDMGTASYLLVGTEGAMKESWGTTCHGSGRLMSRTKARRQYRAEQIINALRDKGIYIHAASLKVVAEETPDAYKDVSQVVEAVEGAGISHKVAKMRPLGVVKG
jgi:tRNA-splicing ligase RtcB